MKATHPLVECFTSSIAVDHRLAKYDVIGSIAHAKMLGACRIIPRADAAAIVKGLTRILRQIERGQFTPDPSVEDIHTQIQQMLTKRVGRAAERLHTARSRNDQVALDLRLYCRDAVRESIQNIRTVQRALVDVAQRHVRVMIPGYTHLQRAQPVLLAHHLLAYVEMLQRDAERLTDSLARINVLPLGAGALAGTSLPINQRLVARLLGFPKIAENSLDAVSDRDVAAELVFDLALLGVHLSRLAEDLILWVSDEFGIAQLDDAFATGSSLMPHKKNPDVLELIRGYVGLAQGGLVAILTVLKGLPLAYNRDLQWDKAIVFPVVERTQLALRVLEPLIQSLKINSKQAARLLGQDTVCATDLAEYLVRKGLPFRQAHDVVGRVVLAAERQGCSLRELGLQELKRLSPLFDRAALAVLDPQRSVERKRSLGSTNPRQVQQALTRWRRVLRTHA